MEKKTFFRINLEGHESGEKKTIVNESTVVLLICRGYVPRPLVDA